MSGIKLDSKSFILFSRLLISLLTIVMTCYFLSYFSNCLKCSFRSNCSLRFNFRLISFVEEYQRVCVGQVRVILVSIHCFDKSRSALLSHCSEYHWKDWIFNNDKVNNNDIDILWCHLQPFEKNFSKTTLNSSQYFLKEI